MAQVLKLDALVVDVFIAEVLFAFEQAKSKRVDATIAIVFFMMKYPLRV